MENLISIIIPTYNRAHIVCETLDSVLSQTYTNWECIVVDDGSTDNTKDIIKSYRVKDSRFLLFNRENKVKGVSYCRNISLENANGDYILFLDSDDLLDKKCLENRLNFINKEKKADVWVFKMQEFNENGLGKECNNYPENVEYQLEYLKMILRYEIPFSVTCPIWKKESLNQINGFDEKFNRMEDPDLHCRAFMAGLNFKFDKETLPDCFYRVDDSSKARSKDPVFMKIFLDSFYKFVDKFSIYENSVLTLKEIKKELRLLVLRVFKEYIFTDVVDENQYENFYKLACKRNILSAKELLIIRVLKLYIVLKLHTVSGLGFYKFRNSIFSNLN